MDFESALMTLHRLCSAEPAGPEAGESTDSDGPDLTSPRSRAQLDLWISELEAQNHASSAPEAQEAQHPPISTGIQSLVPIADHSGTSAHAGQPISASCGLPGAQLPAAQQLQGRATCAPPMSLPVSSSSQPAQDHAYMPAAQEGAARPSENNRSGTAALAGATSSQQARGSDPAALQPRAQPQPLLPTAFEVRMMHAQVCQKSHPFVSSHSVPTQDQPVRYLQLGKHSAPGSGHTFTRQSLPNPQQSTHGSAQVRPTTGCFNPQRPQRPLTSHPIAIPSASAQMNYPAAPYSQHLGAPQPVVPNIQGPNVQGHAQSGSANHSSAQHQQQHASGGRPQDAGRNSWPPVNVQGMPGGNGPHAPNGSSSAPPSSALPIHHSNVPTCTSSAGLPVLAPSHHFSHAPHVAAAACSTVPAQVPTVAREVSADPALPAHRASSGPCDGATASQNPAQAPPQPAQVSEPAAQAPGSGAAQPVRPSAAPRPAFAALQRFEIGKQVAVTAPLGSQGMTLERLMQLLQEEGPQNPWLVRLLQDCRAVFAGLLRMRNARQQDTCSLPDDLEVSCILVLGVIADQLPVMKGGYIQPTSIHPCMHFQEQQVPS